MTKVFVELTILQASLYIRVFVLLAWGPQAHYYRCGRKSALETCLEGSESHTTTFLVAYLFHGALSEVVEGFLAHVGRGILNTFLRLLGLVY